MARWQCASITTHPPIWEDDMYKRDKRSAETIATEAVAVVQRKLTTSPEGFPVELIPIEILYIIMEKLDGYTFVSCLNVSRKWRSVALSIADADRTNRRWKSIYNTTHKEESFKLKSRDLPYKQLFINSLCWNFNFSFTLFGTYTLNHIKKINIYRDNIIVVDSDGVKYFDMHTHLLKREFEIRQCYDFIEGDYFILRCTQDQSGEIIHSKLFLHGKKSMDDISYENAVQRVLNFGDREMNFEHAIMIGVVSQYAIENNCCYILNAHSNVLSCYLWQNNQWDVSNLGRFFGNRDDMMYALTVVRTEVYLFIKWGQMMQYSYEKRNFREVTRVRMPLHKSLLVRMVHKFCIVIGVPGDGEFRITRLRSNEGYNFYKFECPNLTCVTQHGDMLFLGFSDGKIELFMPRAPCRSDMFKRRIHISEFIKTPVEPEDLIVVSIDVFEELAHHYLFIATHSAVYQLMIQHPDDINVWEGAILERPKSYDRPIARFA